jgi:hypothetical protein
MTSENLKIFDKQQLNSPIILIGRGGSGTRLLSYLMRKNGLFIGNEINASEDSVEWVELLYELVVSSLPNRPDIFGNVWQQALREKAENILSIGDLQATRPWGWKLPETMLALPEVCHAFTNAKIIHLVRHPVSSSLRRTHMTSRLNNPVGKEVLERAYKAAGWDYSKILEHEPYQHNAVSWIYQLTQVRQYAENYLKPEQYLEVRFEDLCNTPVKVANTIRKFLNWSELDSSCLKIDPLRTKAYESSDPRIDEIANLCNELASELGYQEYLELLSSPLC